jgi:hypothetical protein
MGPRGKRLAVGASAILVAAVAIIVLAKGMTGTSPSLQTSQGPTFTAVPLQAINVACVEQVGPLVSSLESLDAAVGPNLSFDDYLKMLATSQAARRQIKIAGLDPPCIAAFASAQAALGEYAEAANVWSDCNTTTGCARQSIESSLEDHWARAKTILASVKASMP